MDFVCLGLEPTAHMTISAKMTAKWLIEYFSPKFFVSQRCNTTYDAAVHKLMAPTRTAQ